VTNHKKCKIPIHLTTRYFSVATSAWTVLETAHPSGGLTYSTMLLHTSHVSQPDGWLGEDEEREPKPVIKRRSASSKDVAKSESVHAVHSSSRGLSFLVFGGAQCVGTCVCFGSIWRFDVDSSTWSEIPVSNPPITRCVLFSKSNLDLL
jgi:hypothetical protein